MVFGRPVQRTGRVLRRHSPESKPLARNGTDLYFGNKYKIGSEPRQEITKFHIALDAIVVEPALRRGGSMVHDHGIGTYRRNRSRSSMAALSRCLEG